MVNQLIVIQTSEKIIHKLWFFGYCDHKIEEKKEITQEKKEEDGCKIVRPHSIKRNHLWILSSMMCGQLDKKKN